MAIFVADMLFVFLAVKGGMLLYEACTSAPPPGAKKNLKTQAVRKLSLQEVLFATFVDPFVVLIAPLIRMDEERQVKLKANLARAEIGDSPKEYLAKAVLLALYSLIIPILFFVIQFKAFMYISLFLPIAVYAEMSQGYKRVLAKKKKRIEQALPQFIRAILYKLNAGGGTVKADFIKIFSDYHQIAPPALSYDISMLIFDMKGKGIEEGLNKFNNRLNIPEVGLLTDALIGIKRGEKQGDVLENLAREMDARLRDMQQKELEKRPGQVIKACIPIFAVSVLIIIYIFVEAIATNLTEMM